MSTLSHKSTAVHPTLRLIEPPVQACPSKHGWANQWCYQLHPTDMAQWCDDCLGGADPTGELPDWMDAPPTPEPDAPGEARLPMPDWIEVQAQVIRLMGSDLAEWLAAKIDELAAECRWLDAITPAEFDARAEALAATIAEHDARADRDDFQFSPGCMS